MSWATPERWWPKPSHLSGWLAVGQASLAVLHVLGPAPLQVLGGDRVRLGTSCKALGGHRTGQLVVPDGKGAFLHPHRPELVARVVAALHDALESSALEVSSDAALQQERVSREPTQEAPNGKRHDCQRAERGNGPAEPLHGCFHFPVPVVQHAVVPQRQDHVGRDSHSFLFSLIRGCY